jgi:hypothetical protein
MPSGPLPFGDLFNASVRTTLRLWKPLFLGLALYFAIFMVLFLIMGVSMIGMFTSLPFSEGSMPQLSPGLFLFPLLVIAALSILGIACTIGMLVLAVERAPRLRDTLKRIFPLFGRYIAVSFWMFIRSWMWVPMLLLLILPLLAGGDPRALLPMFALIYLGILVCGFIFGPRVMFGQFIFLREPVSGLQSVKLSEQRTKGYWGKIVGNWLLCVLILGVVYFAVQLALGTVIGGFGHADQNAAVAGMAAFGIIGLILMVIVYPFLFLMPLVFLSDLHDTIKANPKK